jgi:hypothetical protein
MRRFCQALLFVTIVVLAVGCQKGEKLYNVSGTVTYAGKPIPKGQIFFDPVTTKGTPGGQGFANIENGKYDTSVSGKGLGIRGGHYHVRILGFDGIEAPEAPFGTFLFPEYELHKELAAEDQTFDVEVPKRKR